MELDQSTQPSKALRVFRFIVHAVAIGAAAVLTLWPLFVRADEDRGFKIPSTYSAPRGLQIPSEPGDEEKQPKPRPTESDSHSLPDSPRRQFFSPADDRGHKLIITPEEGKAFGSSEESSPVRLEPSQIAKKSEDASCKVYTTGTWKDAPVSYVGSGTVIQYHGNTSLILTCWHLIRDVDDARASVLIGGRKLAATIVKKDRRSDLMLLQVNARLAAARIAKENPKIGSSVYSIGDGGQDRPVFRMNHKVTAISPYDGQPRIETDGSQKMGRSGGGLFNGDGELVGVICSMKNNTDESIYSSTDQINKFLSGIDGVHSLTFGGGLQIPSDAKADSPVTTTNRIIVMFYTGEQEFGKGWCRNCPRYKELYGDGNNSIEMVYSDLKPKGGPGLYPAIRFGGDSGESFFPASPDGTYLVPESLEHLTEIVERNISKQEDHQGYAPVGSAGKLRLKREIQQAVSIIRDKAGEDVPMSFTWMRGETSTLALFHQQDWTPEAIFGVEGSLLIDIPDAKNLPIKSAGGRYRLVGHDVRFDADEIVIPNLVDSLGVSQKKMQSPQTYGIFILDDVLVGYQIVSMVNAVSSLLWPSFDLFIPQRISAVAVLRGDQLEIDFSSPVTVKIWMLFRFNLQVKQVLINDQRVHLVFTGSSWIRSRDLEVEE